MRPPKPKFSMNISKNYVMISIYFIVISKSSESFIPSKRIFYSKCFLVHFSMADACQSIRRVHKFVSYARSASQTTMILFQNDDDLFDICGRRTVFCNELIASGIVLKKIKQMDIFITSVFAKFDSDDIDK